MRQHAVETANDPSHPAGRGGAGPFRLALVFDNGARKMVNLRPLLGGPVFEPLHDPAFFARVELDPICGTVVWPNGADLAPEALREPDAEEASSAA